MVSKGGINDDVHEVDLDGHASILFMCVGIPMDWNRVWRLEGGLEASWEQRCLGQDVPRWQLNVDST